jgi:hypothetical protein
MKNSTVNYKYSRKATKNTAFDRKLERILHDPIRFETGGRVSDRIGVIKAVKLC